MKAYAGGSERFLSEIWTGIIHGPESLDGLVHYSTTPTPEAQTIITSIKQLAGDDQPLETLRMVCGHVKNLEYMQGPDGEERVRRRDGWKDFVLPMADRLPAAQNDGPAIQPEYMPYQELPHGSGEAMPFIPAQMRSPQSGMDPMNGRSE